MSTLKTITKRIDEYLNLDRSAKDAASKANKVKTKLKNEFVEFLRDNEYPVGTLLRVEDKEFSFAKTEAEVIPPEIWLQWYENKKITREQFLQALSIGKAEANRIIGQDQVKAIAKIVHGKNADLRVSTAKYNPDKNVRVEIKRPVIKIRTRRRPYANNKATSKLRRKIKLKG